MGGLFLAMRQAVLQYLGSSTMHKVSGKGKEKILMKQEDWRIGMTLDQVC